MNNVLGPAPSQAQFDDAIARGAFREANLLAEQQIRKTPKDPDAWRNRALAADRIGNIPRALRAWEEISLLSGETGATCYERARLLFRAGRTGVAQLMINRGIHLAPTDAKILRFKLEIEEALGRPEASAASISNAYDSLCEADGGAISTELKLLVARAKWIAADEDSAYELYTRIAAADSNRLGARVAAMRCATRFFYDDDAAIPRARKDFQAHLKELIKEAGQDADFRRRVLPFLTAGTLFRLPYQGRNDMDLMRQYGELLASCMRASFPNASLATAEMAPPPAAGRRIRVGVAGSFFQRHASWNNRRGFFYNLDRTVFETYLYDLGTEFDDYTAYAYGAFEHVRKDDGFIRDWIWRIRNDRLDILIYPELGMNATVLAIAALRLAPVQARMAGHPETCGLPTIDDILTSDLMEPDDAQAHYTERVVRLSGTGFYRYRPDFVPQQLQRADVGLSAGDTVFFYGHNILKMRPAEDELLPRIAEAVPTAKFCLIKDEHNVFWSRLDERLRQAFTARGLDHEAHIVWFPRLPTRQFQGLIHLSDIYLDCPAWNGDNITVDALMAACPTVSAPGPFMRARHTLGFFKRMGLAHYICADLDDMVAFAAKLAHDPDLRAQMHDNIRDASDSLFTEEAALDDFERYLRQRVAWTPAADS